MLKWCLIETRTVQPFCCHKHLNSKIKKEKKKLHFYLLLELGTLLCNMCCNSEDMWVLEAWCHMTATFWGNHPFAAPAIMWPISAARRRLTSNIVPAHTRVSAEQRVCVSVQKRIGESPRRAWGRVYVDSLKTPFHQWRPSPLRAEPLLWYWSSSVAWLVVYLCTKLTVESMWWIFFS